MRARCPCGPDHVCRSLRPPTWTAFGAVQRPSLRPGARTRSPSSSSRARAPLRPPARPSAARPRAAAPPTLRIRTWGSDVARGAGSVQPRAAAVAGSPLHHGFTIDSGVRALVAAWPFAVQRAFPAAAEQPDRAAIRLPGHASHAPATGAPLPSGSSQCERGPDAERRCKGARAGTARCRSSGCG